MPAPRRLSQRQLNKLVDFAENHRDAAVGRGSGALAFKATREAWRAIGAELNSVADGIKKTPEQWRRYWIEFKAKTKLKAADMRRHAAYGAGEQPGRKLVPLSELERRVLALVGPVKLKRLHGVWLPLTTKSEAQPEPELDSEPSAEETTENEDTVCDTLQDGCMKVERSSSPEGVGEVQVEQEVEIDQERLGYEEPVAHTNNVREGNGHTRMNDVLVFAGPAHSAPQRRKKPKVRQDDNVPRWAYNLERRRIAVEERQAAAMEALVDIMRDIRDDIRRLDPDKSRL